MRAYFQSLRDQLNVQEAAALTVVDTYIRERLCSMRQQEEDCENILSQVIIRNWITIISIVINSTFSNKPKLSGIINYTNIGCNSLCKLRESFKAR